MVSRERRGSSADSTFLVALVVTTAAAEVWMAWHYFGFLTGDDVEILAEAFRVAVGFKYRAWDIRSVFVPDVIVAPFVWLGAKCGLTDVRTLIVMATLPSIIAQAISTVLIYALALEFVLLPPGEGAAQRRMRGAPHPAPPSRFARRQGHPLPVGEGHRIARVAAALFALHWIVFGFASTVYPRTIATTCILAALSLLVRDASALHAIAAGALCGIAFADRFSEGVFLLPLLIAARKRAVVLAAAFAVTVALVVGLFDFMTWGEWFGSVRKFAALTLFESDFASRLKHQSAWWYLLNLTRWFSPALLPFLWHARRERLLAAFVLIPMTALSLVAHKELRYLHGVIPFAMLLAAIGFGAMRQRRTAIALVAIGIVWQLYGLRFLTKKSMPAVEAAQMLGADRRISAVTMSQLWAYGDRLYFTDRMAVLDIGTPPRGLAAAIRGADAVCLYESDLTPDIRATMRAGGFVPLRTFRYANAREVVVFTRSSSATSDRAP
ncbi:MAG TPA: hypothetical protein VGS96_23140 [Thermoanaerobaculia bacterium]|jgi:hypothetical protein|nr:hypothetical protein [Thermoanaerobaculia bacterium]